MQRAINRRLLLPTAACSHLQTLMCSVQQQPAAAAAFETAACKAGRSAVDGEALKRSMKAVAAINSTVGRQPCMLY